MQDVIKKLVEIDEQAKAFSEETEKQKEEYEAKISEESEKVYGKYMDDAKAEVEEQKKIIEQKSEEKYLKKKEESEKQIKILNQKFNTNADNWVDQIVGDVLAQEDN